MGSEMCIRDSSRPVGQPDHSLAQGRSRSGDPRGVYQRMTDLAGADAIGQQAVTRKTGVVVAATVGNIVSTTPAVSAVFSLFLVPISTEFGWPRSVVSGVLLLTAVMSAIIYPIAGRLSDKWGSRRIILFGSAVFAPAIAGLALANGSVLQFYALFALAAPTSANLSLIHI